MRREYARGFWKRYLGLICNDGGSLQVENPAIDFTVRMKAGEFNALSDEEFNLSLQDVEGLAPIWNKQRTRRASDILLDALRKTEISDAELEELAEIFARCSEETDYEDIASEFEDEGADARPSSVSVEPEDKPLTPREIYERIGERIFGQEEAKRAAALIYYNVLSHRRTNAIFCGPTGCGKSEIWRCMAKLFPGRVRMVDASRLVADGWKGSMHVRDIFEGVSAAALESGIVVVLDEADKICCESAISSSGTDFNALTQNSLLKMLDGDVLEFGREDGRRDFCVDCSRVSVVLLGAFENLLRRKSARSSGGIGFGSAARVECDYANTRITYDDLIDAGMRREIAGRMMRIVPLQPLSAADYRALLMGPVVVDLELDVRAEIEIDDATADFLAEQAVATGLGVRWMKSQLTNALDDLIFDHPKAERYVISIPTEDREDWQRCSA